MPRANTGAQKAGQSTPGDRGQLVPVLTTVLQLVAKLRYSNFGEQHIALKDKPGTERTGKST